jgi:hypothetical protein
MTENCKFRKAILSAFYNMLKRNFGILLILWCSFKLWWNFCLDLLSSKFWLIGDWSIVRKLVYFKYLGFSRVFVIYFIIRKFDLLGLFDPQSWQFFVLNAFQRRREVIWGTRQNKIHIWFITSSIRDKSPIYTGNI